MSDNKTYIKSGDILVEGYSVGKPMAVGGYAVVFEGERIWDELPVVIKVPRREATRLDPATFARFEREAEASVRLRHPNVVRMLEFGRDRKGRPYIVMERLQGLPLIHLMQRPLAPRSVARILVQILDALEAAHDLGLVHRDLKPANIFLCTPTPKQATGDEPLKLLDFGLVRGLDDNDPVFAKKLTMFNTPIGTPGYIAPEVLMGGDVTTKADLYSVGIIGHELMTGTPAFPGSRQDKLKLAARFKPARPPSHVRRHRLYPVIARLMAPNPMERYGSAREAMADIEEAMTPWHQRFMRFFGKRPPTVRPAYPEIRAPKRTHDESL